MVQESARSAAIVQHVSRRFEIEVLPGNYRDRRHYNTIFTVGRINFAGVF
jgi:hypothetical protein